MKTWFFFFCLQIHSRFLSWKRSGGWNACLLLSSGNWHGHGASSWIQVCQLGGWLWRHPPRSWHEDFESSKLVPYTLPFLRQLSLFLLLDNFLVNGAPLCWTLSPTKHISRGWLLIFSLDCGNPIWCAGWKRPPWCCVMPFKTTTSWLLMHHAPFFATRSRLHNQWAPSHQWPLRSLNIFFTKTHTKNRRYLSSHLPDVLL